jgi:hypothetical protein
MIHVSIVCVLFLRGEHPRLRQPTSLAHQGSHHRCFQLNYEKQISSEKKHLLLENFSCLLGKGISDQKHCRQQGTV